ncbi:MAG: ferritin-like domain-containing protein [Hyphomicrobium sp.]|nr:ferritin-like domain-containing protein [Hyphomicrobium sp.]
MAIQNLEDLLGHTLEDVYFAEKKILKSLPKMIKAADSSELAKAFEAHLGETEEHVTRLEEAFKMMGKKPKATECPAILGILDEAEELMEEIKDADTLDAAMIASAQAVEHYEITRYGTMIAWAKELGKKDIATLLSKTLKEEGAADKKLSSIAESRLNREAAA